MADFIRLEASGFLPNTSVQYMFVARSVQYVVFAVWESGVGPSFVVRKLGINYRGEKFFYYEGKRYYLPEDSSFSCIVPPDLIL